MIGVKEQENLLLNIARQLKSKMTVYAIGGTAMMFHGFKESTNDIDLVFISEENKLEFKAATVKSGFSPINSITVYGTKKNQPIMLARGKKEEEERFDLFEDEVIDFIFSENMMNRAKAIHEFGTNLILKIADPHDIILMKCATDRLKDQDDARNIINEHEINWKVIIEESKNQLKLGRKRAVWDFAGFVMDIRKIGANISLDVEKELLGLLEEQPNSK